MKILFSHPEKIKNEITIIDNMLDSNEWDLFHLRKPTWDKDNILSFYKKLSKKSQKKTIIHHEKNISCHTFNEVKKIDHIEPYCFLSPIFDSISKKGYTSKFSETTLKTFLKAPRNIKIIALGGITKENYDYVITLGFDGAAFLGSIWTEKNS